MLSRNVYLKTITRMEALGIIHQRVGSLVRKNVTRVPLAEAFGRYTAEAVFAVCSNPNHNAAAMDGIAVIAGRTEGAHEREPVVLVEGVDFKWVNTGHLIEPPYDAVIMVEDLEVDASDLTKVSIRSAAHTWQHVRMVGEDIAIGDMLLTREHCIRPVDLGALAAAGIEEILVYAPVKVGLIPTGSEIVHSVGEMRPGSILESNTLMFSGMVRECGAVAMRYPVVADSKRDLKKAIEIAAADCDLVVVNAGSSAGSEDYTKVVLEELGEVVFHGIDIKPGKPSLFAVVGDVPVFGIPGYPVSAFVAFDALVTPLLAWSIYHLEGEDPMRVGTVGAMLTRPVISSLKNEEFVRVQMGTIDGKQVVTPVARGAGATMSLVKANGMLMVPRASEGLEAGTCVQVKPLVDLSGHKESLVVIGSHDLAVDLMCDLAVGRLTIQSAHVGSLGGIMALMRQEAHVAPIHLLDEETGEYNVSFVRRYFKDQGMVLIRAIGRTQGFYTRPSDGLRHVGSFKEVAERGLSFVNRQKGSGTRMLSDHVLKQEGLVSQAIKNYDLEVLTHTAVAQAIAVGNADIGVGIESVALKMGLLFHPIAQESYDFLVRESALNDPNIIAFIDLLKSEAFKTTLEQLGGYRLSPVEMIHVNPEEAGND